MKRIVFAALAALCLTVVSALELEDSNTSSSSNYTFPANSSSPCFILRGVVQYSVHRPTPGGEVWEGTFHDDGDDAIVAGNCSAPDPNVKGQLVSTLTIGNTISEHYVELEMHFLQNQSTKSWKGGEFVLKFPDNGKSWTADAETGSFGSAESLSASTDQGIKCSQANISINGTSGKGLIMLSNFTIYPGFVNVTSPVVTCPYDQSPATSNVVPIAVGCALAGLVLIVLVAYLIGRTRHERQHKGYQSV